MSTVTTRIEQIKDHIIILNHTTDYPIPEILRRIVSQWGFDLKEIEQ